MAPVPSMPPILLTFDNADIVNCKLRGPDGAVEYETIHEGGLSLISRPIKVIARSGLSGTINLRLESFEIGGIELPTSALKAQWKHRGARMWHWSNQRYVIHFKEKQWMVGVIHGSISAKYASPPQARPTDGTPTDALEALDQNPWNAPPIAALHLYKPAVLALASEIQDDRFATERLFLVMLLLSSEFKRLVMN
ncbi:hypothetical protein K438DRAFT_1805214, partial [Mycena galopus ATCC 62051]